MRSANTYSLERAILISWTVDQKFKIQVFLSADNNISCELLGNVSDTTIANQNTNKNSEGEIRLSMPFWAIVGMLH